MYQAANTSPAVPTDGKLDDTERAELMAALRGGLQQIICEHKAAAVNARAMSGIEEVWIEDEDQYDGIDNMTVPTGGVISSKANPRQQLGQAQGRGAPRSRVFLNITKPKVDIWTSRVQQMLLPHDDRPWQIDPTPVPDIDEAIAVDDQTPVQMADGAVKPAVEVARAAAQLMKQAAEEASKHIDDWMVEGDVYGEMRKVIRDAGKCGTGVLMGPTPVTRTDRKWTRSGKAGPGVTVVERIAPASRKVSYWDCFPDPSCGDSIHHGSYFVWRDYLTQRQLRRLARDPGYDREAIAECLKEGPNRIARQDQRANRYRDGDTQSTHEWSVFEAYHYFGDLTPQQLVGAGWAKIVDTKERDAGDGQQHLEPQDEEQAADRTEEGLIALTDDDLLLTTLPIIATIVNDRIIRVTLNWNEEGDFPFDFLVCEAVDGQPWGRGKARQMAVAQKMLNAGVRALLENAGLAAGVQIVAAQGAIQSADGSNEISGRRLWTFTPSPELDDVRKAFGVFTIPSVQKEMQAIIDFALRMADELTNLPMMMQGIVGDAPDTLGGLRLLQQNAASPLKTFAKTADDQLFVPHLKRYYAWLLMDPNVPDSAKGDLQIKARGSTALVQREDGQMFLAASYALTNDKRFRIDPEKWFLEVARAHHFDGAAIQYDDATWKQIQEQEAKNPPPPDPRVQAAELNRQTKLETVQAELADRELARQQAREEAQLDRALQAMVKEIELQIQTMEFAGEREASIDQVKAMLAKAAMEIRNKREMFAAEVAFAQGDGEGRGI